MSENIMQSPDYVVSETILQQRAEFKAEDIFESVRDKLISFFDNSRESLLNFVKNKINALWEARLLTFTGFSYYVNV